MGGSVATLDEHGTLHVVSLDATQRSARALAPAMHEALRLAGWQPRDVRVVAVTAGPGSFTGLRIGVTTAKTFCYAVGADLIAVDTLDVLARQAENEHGYERLHTVLDAHRSELFAASYQRNDSGWARSTPTHLVGSEAWLASLKSGDTVTGPVVSKLQSQLPSGVTLIETSLREPNAGAVAQLAAGYYRDGRRDDPWKLTPWYGRLAAAEEKRLRS